MPGANLEGGGVGVGKVFHPAYPPNAPPPPQTLYAIVLLNIRLTSIVYTEYEGDNTQIVNYILHSGYQSDSISDKW